MAGSHRPAGSPAPQTIPPSDARKAPAWPSRRAFLRSGVVHLLALLALLLVVGSPRVIETPPEPIIVDLVLGEGGASGAAGGGTGGGSDAAGSGAGGEQAPPTPPAEATPAENTTADAPPVDASAAPDEVAAIQPTPTDLPPDPSGLIQAIQPRAKPTPPPVAVRQTPQATAALRPPTPLLPPPPVPTPLPQPVPAPATAPRPGPAGPAPPAAIPTPGRDAPGTGAGPATGEGSGTGAAGSGPGAGTAGIGTQAGNDYLERLKRHLARHRDYPRAAINARQEGTVQFSIVIAADGRVLGARIERSSGHVLLDEAALAMVQRANPVPPLPPEMGLAQAEVVLPSTFTLGFFDTLF